MQMGGIAPKHRDDSLHADGPPDALLIEKGGQFFAVGHHDAEEPMARGRTVVFPQIPRAVSCFLFVPVQRARISVHG